MEKIRFKSTNGNPQNPNNSARVRLGSSINDKDRNLRTQNTIKEVQETARQESNQKLFEAAGALGVNLIPKTNYSKMEYDYKTGTYKTPQQKFAENISQSMSGDNYTKYLQTEIQKKLKENETSRQEIINFDSVAAEKEIADLERKLANMSSVNWDVRGNIGQANAQNNANAINEIKTQIAEKRIALNQKKRLQELLKSNENAVNDPDYAKYVNEGKATSWQDVGKATGTTGGPNVSKTTYDDLGAAAWALYKHNNPTAEKPLFDNLDNAILFEQMTEDEFDLLAYHIGKDKETGENQAETYVELMKETLQTRKGQEIYEQYLKDNTVLEVLYGVPAGLDQFANGVTSLFNFKDDYIPTSSVQVAGQLAREDLADDTLFGIEVFGSSLGQMAYDTVQTTANMAPSIAASALVNIINPVAGTVTGAALMGGSAAGNAYQEALNNGWGKGEARTYSLLVGSSEAALSAVLSKVLGGSIVSNAVNKAIEGVTNGFARFALNYGAAFVSEGVEEGLQELLTPLFENIALGYNKNGFEDIDWSEVAYSFLLGGLSGGMFEAADRGFKGGVKKISSAVSVMKEYNTPAKTQNLLKLALSMPTDSKANKLATKYNAQLKSNGKLSVNKAYNLVVATENVLTERLTKLGETKNASAIASAMVKSITTGQLTAKEISVLQSSKHGAELLKQINVTEEAETPVLQSSANSGNSALQSDAAGGIINEEQQSISGDDINGSTNPELLAGRTVSTAGRSGNGVRQQGENSRKISSFVGNGANGQGSNNSPLRAGDSGWFVRQAEEKGEVRNRFEESVRGKISRIAPSGFDTIGRKISNEIKEKFKNTVFKDENGNLFSLYHWTQATFEAFAKGEFGFHFGTLDAAHDRYTQSLEEDSNTQKGIYKEVYLNITNPFYIPFDAGVWSAEPVVYQLKLEGIITEEQQNHFRKLEGFDDNTYDNPAAQAVREFLKQKGYDGIIYENDSEDVGGISVIAFDADQILTVAENGVLKENSGVSEADLDNGPASFMPENDSGAFDNASDNSTDDSGELGFREPDVKGIYRKSTDAETAEGILTGKRIDNKMRHINDIAKKLDSGLKIVWCEKNSDKLHGKNGKYVRETNTMYLAKDIGIAQMYHEVFKHEFVHRLESKKAYQAFEKYLFEKSKAFENYARAQLKLVNPDKVYETRTDVLDDLVEEYLYQVKNDNSLPLNIRKGFDWEDAKREVVADFVGETLFKGKGNRADMAQALSEFDSEYMNEETTEKAVEGFLDAANKDEGNLDLFAEMATDNRNLLQKVIDAIKDFINNLKHVPQNKSLVEDLEYIEQRLSRVYASKDTKKAASQSGGVQYYSSEDIGLHEYIKDALSGKLPKKSFYKVNEVISDRLAADIEKIVGFSVKGYSNEIAPGNIQHIENEHGTKGRKDQSMRNHHDLARVAFIIDNYDKIKEGKISQEYKNKDGTMAKTVELQKRIDDEFYYIVEAVPNVNLKTLHIVSAYKNKKDTFSDVPVSNDPRRYVQDEHQPNVSNDIIGEKPPSVNNNFMQESENNSENGKMSIGSPAQQARENKITMSMSEDERANVLRNKTISNVPIVENLSKEIVDKLENISSWEDFNALLGKEKRNLIQKLAREFGVFKTYKNSDINLSFEFSNNNYRESFGKQKRNFENFAKMFSVFDRVIESAVGIEVHKRENYKPDSTLKSVYVLMSCFEDGDTIVPVKLEVKEFKDKQNTLYVAISLEAIKKTEVSKQGTTENSVAQNSHSVTISILDLFKKINPKDKNFLKYIPDEFLNAEQRNAKTLALNEENGQFSSGSPSQQARENLDKYERGEITLEEYLEANDELWGKANQEFGTLPQGENAQAPIATPKAVAEDKPTERFTRTIIETGKLSEEMLQGMEEKVLLGDFAYKPISDEVATKTAQAAINNGTAEDIWNDAVNVGKRFNKNQIAIGEQLLADAIKNGDTKRVLELSAELADVLTRAGQIVQAARLLKKMTGAGRLVTAQRMVKTINKDLRQKYGEDRVPIKISDAAAKRLVNAKTEKGIQHAYDEILKEVAEQMPVTWLDKWNAWRYFAMLSNPKTHIRNLVGNAIFVPAFRIRYAMAVGMEQVAVKTGAIKESDKTKSLIIKKEYTDFAKKDGKRDEVKQLLKGNKYNDKTAIKEKQRIFKNDALEFLTTFNSNALEAEDMLFKNKHYIHALAGFLQARGVDLNNVSEDVLTEARIYAVNEARIATFNDENFMAERLQKLSNDYFVAALSIEGILPFKRTPMNIIRRGVEYSPLGLGKTLTKGVYDIKKGKITPTEFIDGLASGLTGTGIMLAGMFLASLGCITGGEEDDEQSDLEKLLGKQEYAVEILGNSYTIDWTAPACIPFFIGVEIVNTINAGEDFTFAQFSNVLWNSLEPITNLSMLSGLQSAIESTRYADGSQVLSSIVGDAITSYAMQGIPSLSGALARTIDSKQRSWYVDRNNGIFDRSAQTLINSVKSKIPGLTYTQIPKIDAWGREVSRGNVGERIVENFVSPGYYSKVEYDEVSEELKRIFVETGANVFPQIAKNSFTFNKQKKYLTADEYVTYAKAKGEYSFDYIYEFVNGSAYKGLSDEERAEVIDNLYDLANAKAKAEVSEYDLMKEYKTVTNREKNGGSAIDYYIYLAIQKK